MRVHPFPFRTRKLSSFLPKILVWRRTGKIGNANIRDSLFDCLFFFLWKHLFEISDGQLMQNGGSRSWFGSDSRLTPGTWQITNFKDLFHIWCGKLSEFSLFSWGKPRGKAADPVRFPQKSFWKVDRKKDQRNLKKSVDICSHIWYYSQALQGEPRAHRTAPDPYESSSGTELQKVWKTWKKFLTDESFYGIINESTARCGVHLVN